MRQPRSIQVGIRPLLALLGLCILATLSGAPAASAQTCIAPPGTSGVEGYCESIPGAGGNRGRGDTERASSGKSDRSVPRETRQDLSQEGKDGQQLLELSQPGGADTQDAPGQVRQPGDTDSGEGDKPASAGGGGSAAPRSAAAASAAREARDEPSDNPLSAITSALTDGPTAGAALGWALILIALLLCGWAWLTYRRRKRGLN